MDSKKKPILRLTIFFISVVLVSGSILAYLSINNISNLKELTEKRVQEEQLGLALELQDQIEEVLFDLGQKFSDAAAGKVLDQLASIRPLDTLDLIGHVFFVDQTGKFLWPWFIEGSWTYSDEPHSINYIRNFEQAEKAEFMEEDFGKASRKYFTCLRISSHKYDSVRALNALARISMKMEVHPRAFEYYSSLISNYHDLCDPYGFPFVYYAIPQLLRIANATNRNSVIEVFEFCLSGMEKGKIPLNHSTRNVLDQLMSWLETIAEPDNSSIQIKTSIQAVENHLSFIEQNKEVIQEHLSEDLDHDSPMISDRYQLIKTNKQNDGEILFAGHEEENVMGFSVPIKQLWNTLTDGDILTNTEFEYELNLVQMNNDINGVELPLTTSFEISPYLPGFYLLIAMEDIGLIDNFVRRRSWIYGISLALLLGGMTLGILLILRDISREEHLARLRTDFISNVTHELKTPLTSIQLFTESMVLKRIKSEQDKKEYLNIILKETESLKRMINNILDFSRKEKGRREYHFEEVNISSLVKEATDDLEYWLVEKQFSLVKEIEDKVFVKADPAALKQAIINLLNNAIKFSVDRKEIFVRLKKGPEYILIQVEDRGIGIPDDQKDLIFQPFYRVGQRHAEDISGTGLGLSVVKEIVDAHHGTISLNSRINEGSCFTIQLKTNMEILT